MEGDSLLNSHPNTQLRMKLATTALREAGIAPALLMTGPDFYVEAAAGASVMKDFFHFDDEAAPRAELAKLLARFHAVPTDWWAPVRQAIVSRDPALSGLIGRAPPYSPLWNLPFSGVDSGKIVMGMGNIPDAATQGALSLMIETGVYEKVMLCEAFYPTSEAARRTVMVHGDFKPDNVLQAADGTLTAIDYDLTCVGSAAHEFGYMLPMWYGKASYDYRRGLVGEYLDSSGLPHAEADVAAFMLDCEVASLTSLPGLLANIYDKEVPLLRGTPHPTARMAKEPGIMAGGADDSPTGPELVDLLAVAVGQIRADAGLSERCVREGLVQALFAVEGLGEPQLWSWLQHMRDSNMLRLFGIAPPS